jgi:hypothetical protein
MRARRVNWRWALQYTEKRRDVRKHFDGYRRDHGYPEAL